MCVIDGYRYIEHEQDCGSSRAVEDDSQGTTGIYTYTHTYTHTNKQDPNVMCIAEALRCLLAMAKNAKKGFAMSARSLVPALLQVCAHLLSHVFF